MNRNWIHDVKFLKKPCVLVEVKTKPMWKGNTCGFHIILLLPLLTFTWKTVKKLVSNKRNYFKYFLHLSWMMKSACLGEVTVWLTKTLLAAILGVHMKENTPKFTNSYQLTATQDIKTGFNHQPFYWFSSKLIFLNKCNRFRQLHVWNKEIHKDKNVDILIPSAF